MAGPKSAPARKLALSSELVQDSDDSGDAKNATTNKPASKTANSRSKSAKPTEPKRSSSQAKPSKKRKSTSPNSTRDNPSDSGSEVDSSSEDENRPSKKRILAAQDGSPTPKAKPATARLVVAKPSIKSSTNVKPFNHKEERGKDAKGKGSKTYTKESSEDSSSGSASGSGSESKSVSRSSDKTSIQSPRKKSPIQKSVSQHSTSHYEPPAGFKTKIISLHPASKVADILAPSNLQGKEIWHITTPGSVPVSLVKEVSTQNVGNGASVLEHRGAKYGLVSESGVNQSISQVLLLPSAQKNDYRPLATNKMKTLHLQQLVNLPNHAFEPAGHSYRSAPAPNSYSKTPRQQPEGLRMRYRPFGVSVDSDLESASEPTPKVPQFRVPPLVKESSPRRKRKGAESIDGSSSTPSAVKSKKRKQSPQATAGAIEDTMDIDPRSDTRLDGAESPRQSQLPQINGNLPNGNETKEERRKRKGKKKLEKQDSPSKPPMALPLDLKQNAETIQPGEVVEGVPLAMNAVEGSTSIDTISPSKESRDQIAERKKEKRRRKEMEKANRDAPLVPAEDEEVMSRRDSQEQIIREIENAQREASIPIATVKASSPRREAEVAVHESQTSTLDSSQGSQRNETKEERAEMREEKRRRRRMERGGV